MKREEKERLKNEIFDINNALSKEELEISDTPKYKEIQKSIDELREGKREDSIRYQMLEREVYMKYGLSGYGFYRGFRLGDIKSSVKQGIKVGLGMTNVKSIEDNIIKIVKEMIAKDLKEPKIEKLNQKNLKAEGKINKLVRDKDNLIKDGTEILNKKRNKLRKELWERKPTNDKKLKKQIEEADEKVKNLPHYLPKIIKEVNRRLILDGVEK